jgi:hypothetical protein
MEKVSLFFIAFGLSVFTTAYCLKTANTLGALGWAGCTVASFVCGVSWYIQYRNSKGE